MEWRCKRARRGKEAAIDFFAMQSGEEDGEREKCCQHSSKRANNLFGIRLTDALTLPTGPAVFRLLFVQPLWDLTEQPCLMNNGFVHPR